MKRPASIPENKDLDEYVSGVFLLYQTDSTIIQTLVHKPSEITLGEVFMFVFTVGVYGVQILFHSSANKTYIRYGHSSAFSDWVLI